MDMRGQNSRRRMTLFIAIFLAVNVIGIFLIGLKESAAIGRRMTGEAEAANDRLEVIMDNYKHSFQFFTQMMAREIEHNPDPDQIWNYLKTIDSKAVEIEGDSFSGLYMYYKDRYLYSWDIPYSKYEKTGYVATERPWYKDALAGNGQIVLTPPYMSYANYYMLSTISQLQPDGETVFAYDIKLGDIQSMISSQQNYVQEQVLAFDQKGTIVGSTNAEYLGGNFYNSLAETKQTVTEAENEISKIDSEDTKELAKAKEKLQSAAAFYTFRENFDDGFSKIRKQKNKTISVRIDGRKYYGCFFEGTDFNFLVLIPFWSMMKATMSVWLIPLLVIELLLIYVLSRISKEIKNRELKAAYIELGQTQKRLEVALHIAKKAAAIDDLTGTMNAKSFKKEVTDLLNSMSEGEHGILVMMDGDHFKQINDTYGHCVGDEVIKLSAQMIIGRIRTVDIASRLHGDEFAIFVSDTADYTVAKSIAEDINAAIKKEAEKRKMPFVTLSAGAAIAQHGDTYGELMKAADMALYKAKDTHDGGFSC